MNYRDRGALTVMEACEFLGKIGVTKFYELVASGEIQITKIGSRSVVLITDLEAFLAKVGDRAND